MFENLGFLKSKFSIFTIGEYRKHGFIKVGEKNPRYPRHPRFRSGRAQLPQSVWSQGLYDSVESLDQIVY